mmetsp:Transcript_33933/g.91884  ORF Transcript_33933/g.91884 Transcript_33933/m.91884 type:complete len:251 (+) Transcript_33933:216-968(+)
MREQVTGPRGVPRLPMVGNGRGDVLPPVHDPMVLHCPVFRVLHLEDHKAHATSDGQRTAEEDQERGEGQAGTVPLLHEEGLHGGAVEEAGDDVDDGIAAERAHEPIHQAGVLRDNPTDSHQSDQDRGEHVLSPHEVKGPGREDVLQHADERLAQGTEHDGVAGNQGEANQDPGDIHGHVLQRVVLQDGAARGRAEGFEAGVADDSVQDRCYAHGHDGAIAEVPGRGAPQLSVVLAGVAVAVEGHGEDVDE